MSFNRSHGIWHPRFDDKFDRKTLLKVKEFFIEDLALAQADVERITKFANMKLTPSKKGFSGMIMVARECVRQSMENIKTVNALLKQYPE